MGKRLPYGQKMKGVGGGNRHPSLTRRQKDRLTSWGEVCQPVNAITNLCTFSHVSIHRNHKFVNLEFEGFIDLLAYWPV